MMKRYDAICIILIVVAVSLIISNHKKSPMGAIKSDYDIEEKE